MRRHRRRCAWPRPAWAAKAAIDPWPVALRCAAPVPGPGPAAPRGTRRQRRWLAAAAGLAGWLDLQRFDKRCSAALIVPCGRRHDDHGAHHLRVAGRMAWFARVLAGLFEVGRAIGLTYADGRTRVWPTLRTPAAMVVGQGLARPGDEVVAGGQFLRGVARHRRAGHGDPGRRGAG
jgi:hypothetical protein